MKYYLHQKHANKDMTIRSFANLLANELLSNQFDDCRPEDDNFTMMDSLPGDRGSASTHHPTSQGTAGVEEIVELRASGSSGSVSDLTDEREHRMVAYPTVMAGDGKSRRARRNRCRVCLQKGMVSSSCFYCADCRVCFCADGSGGGNQVRMCWTEHKCQVWGNASKDNE